MLLQKEDSFSWIMHPHFLPTLKSVPCTFIGLQAGSEMTRVTQFEAVLQQSDSFLSTKARPFESFSRCLGDNFSVYFSLPHPSYPFPLASHEFSSFQRLPTPCPSGGGGATFQNHNGRCRQKIIVGNSGRNAQMK